ncbi:cytochrome P450 [Massarina eburnea CBS 473.64]|uniref:Cytochrome P450 n=1 Tax=Massarina eburnea CBS 473.64 TaxID=1395130 RepID=A0A6A6SB49_9PLEO|nr:cytochrome P450 [Massarina eburnea CBS 473.64]
MALTISPTVLLVSGAVVLYALYTRIALYLRRRAFKKQHGCQPSYYRYNKDPFLGWDVLQESITNAADHKLLAGMQARFLKLNTKTFHSRQVNVPLITTCEPENVKTVLSIKFKDYSLGNRKAAFSPLLGDGIFNSDGEKWSNSRHLLRPNFARDQVADLEAFERHFKLMIKHIPSDGTTFDLQQLFFRFTLDSATEFLFNHSTNSLRVLGDDSGSAEAAFAKAFSSSMDDILQHFRAGPLHFFRRGKKEGLEAVRVCHEYVERFVDEAIAWRRERDVGNVEEKEGDRYIFIRELVKQTTDRTALRNELINVLLAGRDTTASLLSNMFFEIATKSGIWERLKEEVKFLEGRPPSYEELRNMKYIKWCLNESLRLHPVVPGNTRLAIRDTVLPLGGGPDQKAPLFVPAGTTVGYSPYTMHRRTDLYGPDAHLFRPERWDTLRPSWEYLPFNGGPRICLGQQYALTEASFVTVRLAQMFDRLESRDTNGGVWVEGLGLTLCSGNGVLVGLVKGEKA